MADSLREAAEAVIDQCAMLPVYANTPSSWTRGINSVWEQAAKLKAALSEPDPVAEAREIISRMIDGYEYLARTSDTAAFDLQEARDWLQRNGDTE